MAWLYNRVEHKKGCKSTHANVTMTCSGTCVNLTPKHLIIARDATRSTPGSIQNYLSVKLISFVVSLGYTVLPAEYISARSSGRALITT